jgi:hypothetical protein
MVLLATLYHGRSALTAAELVDVNRRYSCFTGGRGKGGPQHKAAREACIAVLAGEKPPAHARQAFVEAAKEAGILMEYDW